MQSLENSLFAQEFIKGKVLLFDKPLYWTSFDLVNKVKSILRSQLNLKNIKVGHAGTLDPLASGLMIVCTGQGTKKIELYQFKEKEYLAKIRLGATTPSFDLETEIDEHFPFDHIKQSDIEIVLKNLTGKQLQQPPQFSAKFFNGTRAYKFARKGETVELNPKEIVIHSIKLTSFHIPDIEINVVCSTGTYIRALARDIGIKLKTGAHLICLERLRIGNFKLNDAIKIDEFERNLVLL